MAVLLVLPLYSLLLAFEEVLGAVVPLKVDRPAVKPHLVQEAGLQDLLYLGYLEQTVPDNR